MTLTRPHSVDQDARGGMVWEGSPAVSEDRGRPMSPCGKPSCPEHSTLCAFHGDEPDRCPWCHSLWSTILTRGPHSCETSGLWQGPRAKWRASTARKMRESAATATYSVDQSEHCAHLGTDTSEDLAGRGRRDNGSPGTRGFVLVECGTCDRRFGVMAETIGHARCSRCLGTVAVLGAPEDHGKSWNEARA